MSLFCRHGRFVADCSICSKGTVLDPARGGRKRSGGTGTATRSRAQRAPKTVFSGPQVSAGPYEDGDGVTYVVRLERVPGGLRLGEWAGSELRRRAPVLAASDLTGLIAAAADVLPVRDVAPLAEAMTTEAGDGSAGGAGVSRGRAGDFKEELRVEPLEGGWLRIGRWVLQPGAGWQLRDAAPMLPAARYAQALADAMAKGALAAGAPADR